MHALREEQAEGGASCVGLCVRKLEEDKRLELVVLCPSYVQGPLLSVASGAISAYLNINLLEHKMPGFINTTFNVVDVRDVAGTLFF